MRSLLPRFANRGLIEAPSLGWSPPASASLPRFANRGLIEADRYGTAADAHQHFPDSRIGASLKPVDPPDGVTIKDTSPIRESGPH